jgi:hypothetical protein
MPAVHKGRQAVLHSDSQSLEWGIPTLYLRAKDGVLYKELGLIKDTQKEEIIQAFLDAVASIIRQGGEIQKIKLNIKTKLGPMNITLGPFT